MDWSRTEISELINLYRQYECLWNPFNEDYNNGDSKQTAWMEIACVCGKDTNDVRRKIKHLRSAYVAEKKKCETSKKHGVAYMPNLFYYKDFDFLDAVVVLRKSTLPPSTSQSFLSSRSNRSRERKQKITKVDRKTLRDTKFNNAIDAIVASVQASPANNGHEEHNECNNVFSSFGKTTALQLQQLPMDKATEAMAAIYQLIAKRTLDSLKKSTPNSNQRRNGVISFETMSP
ncbi:hypothetical protein DOY81_000942 [Sarcophaga bullata]|nr:hypothetical protein DOY81_000942 [Sarcophaga bullata]